MAKHRLITFFLLIFISTLALVPCRASSGSGTWEVLQTSIGISAMHMQLLHDNQVVMFDRTDFGRSNLSLPGGPRGCRKDSNDMVLKDDCTAHSIMYDIERNTFRPLMVWTDTWCSSGAVLPNGTLLQTGGFNDGDRVVRLISPGLVSDWVERPGYLAVRRWYATNQILPNGGVIIVGGRKQFNYEFFPRNPTATVTPFSFLKQTSDSADENNLYPFLHLLPDNTLFIFANTLSIIFDHVHNNIIRTLPPIPDNAPRNYPSSGSSVLLPINLGSETPKAEVLVCGGAEKGARGQAMRGEFVKAVRTCGRIVATEEGADWWMETMPVGRVMGDMLLLPSGDVVVINGAGRGTAGWEMGREPVLTPVLYRTSMPPNRRFQVLNGTKTPRMYHSSAIVDPYGRVLVGGSNPHVFYNFTGVEYPTELSLEAFYPPYLDHTFDHRRPTIYTLEQEIVLFHGEPFVLGFELDQYNPSRGVDVVMLAPSFTTHSIAMNQRLLMLVVDAVWPVGLSSYQLSTRTPATAAIAPPGYYMVFVVHGGVPSRMGVWLRIR